MDLGTYTELFIFLENVACLVVGILITKYVMK